MIQLQVPEGKGCEGCMFLEMDYNIPVCNLFKERLSSIKQNGVTDMESIMKCDSCPRG